MATTQNPSTDATPPAEEPKDVKEKVERFSADYFVTNAVALLGADSPTVAGALAGSSRKTFSVNEAKDALNKFRKRPADHSAPAGG